jgi:hypothetical protein
MPGDGSRRRKQDTWRIDSWKFGDNTYQDNGPQAYEKDMLKSQVLMTPSVSYLLSYAFKTTYTMMKPQPAVPLEFDEGGNNARKSK